MGGSTPTMNSILNLHNVDIFGNWFTIVELKTNNAKSNKFKQDWWSFITQYYHKNNSLYIPFVLADRPDILFLNH